MHAAETAGWDGVGVDSSPIAIELARAGPGAFYQLDAQALLQLDGAFGVVSLFDVIEHFVDPLQTLRVAARLLDDDGVVLLTTPNVDGWLRHDQGADYHHYSSDHEVLFTRQALCVLAQRAKAAAIEVVDLGEELLALDPAAAWFATVKYTRYRSHLLGCLRW